MSIVGLKKYGVAYKYLEMLWTGRCLNAKKTTTKHFNSKLICRK